MYIEWNVHVELNMYTRTRACAYVAYIFAFEFDSCFRGYILRSNPSLRVIPHQDFWTIGEPEWKTLTSRSNIYSRASSSMPPARRRRRRSDHGHDAGGRF